MTFIETGLSAGPRYCWRRDWVAPYESLWSLLHKFAALNWVCVYDAKQLFQKTSTTDYWQRRSHSKWNLHTLGGFDAEKLCEILKLSTEDLSKSLVTSLISSLEISWLTPETVLRYCPECITQGYHSIFHQLYAISKCPIHDIELTEQCQHCGNKITYELNYRRKAIPYGCPVCHMGLWEPRRQTGEAHEINILDLDEVQESRLDKLFAWFDTVRKTAGSLTNMERWPETAAPWDNRVGHKTAFMEMRGEETLGYWGELIGCNPPPPIKFRSKVGAVHVSARYWAKYPYETIQRRASELRVRRPDRSTSVQRAYHDIDDYIFKIYKAVRRHITKTFLGGIHKKCAGVISKSIYWDPRHLDSLPLCPRAFAYLFWRKRWEIKKYGYSSRTTCFVWDIRGIEYGPLTTEHERNWLLFRICAQECYWTFLECVILANKMNRQGKFNWDDAQICGRLLPYWAVEVSDSRRPVFHWWPYKSLPSQVLNATETNRCHQQMTIWQADAMMPCKVVREAIVMAWKLVSGLRSLN